MFRDFVQVVGVSDCMVQSLSCDKEIVQVAVQRALWPLIAASDAPDNVLVSAVYQRHTSLRYSGS